ncbi:MAG: D-alanyl-D-alanine carboxypeptidase [Alphaproteobacteria bacterium]|nr:D-alanyl-D-alanine carboxypeptidase [Alphaproteobacteria bacterium]
MGSVCGFLFRLFAVFLFVVDVGEVQTSTAAAPKKSAIVIDYTNGRHVLFADHPDAKRYPASITKVMTVYLLFEAIKKKHITMNTEFRVSKLASQQIPSKLGVKVGQKMKVSDIIKALLVKSANDVAVVAAEGVAGSVAKFCKMMNKKGRQLGMRNTHFANPSGVPDTRQVSSARDLAKLGMAIFRDFPQYWHFFSEKKFVFGKNTHKTHCKILHWYKGADGAKTGYICASGFNLLVTANRYDKLGRARRIFTVVMGGKSAKERDLYAAQLMDKYLKGYTASPQKQSLQKSKGKTAKQSLLEQVSKSEMLDKVVQEENEVLVTETASDFNAMLDELYRDNEEVVAEEEAVLVSPKKR